MQANKKHSFHSWRKLSEERRCQSPERSGAEGRGSEHGAGLVYAPSRAAQAGLTGGADRSARLRRERNVGKKDQPKAEPKNGGKALNEPDFLLAGSGIELPCRRVIGVPETILGQPGRDRKSCEIADLNRRRSAPCPCALHLRQAIGAYKLMHQVCGLSTVVHRRSARVKFQFSSDAPSEIVCNSRKRSA